MIIRTPEALAFIYVAEILVGPWDSADANPVVAFTVAIAGTEEVHVAD